MAGRQLHKLSARKAETLAESGRYSDGGGLYLTPGGIACADLVTAVLAHDASTSDDDVFGALA